MCGGRPLDVNFFGSWTTEAILPLRGEEPADPPDLVALIPSALGDGARREPPNQGLIAPEAPFWRFQDAPGATVLRGIEGFGAKAHLHTTRILRLSEDLPMLVEVVDQEERIRAVLPELDEMVGDGLITMQKVEVIAYRATEG